MSFGYMMSPYTAKAYDIAAYNGVLPQDKAAQTIQEERYYAAMEAVAYLYNKGFMVYSPIVHNHELALVYSLPKDVDFWQQHNRSLLAKASYALVLQLPGYENSKGIQELEVPFAKACGVPIFYGASGKELHEELPAWLAQ